MLLRLLVQSLPPLLTLQFDLVALQLLHRCLVLLRQHQTIRSFQTVEEVVGSNPTPAKCVVGQLVAALAGVSQAV